MLKFFVKRPVTTVMFTLFFVVLGIVAYPKMNVELTPPVDFPMVTATFVYPGASSVEVESQVVKKAEDAISQVSGVKKITSQAFENGAFVIAEFNLSENVNDKSNEVKSKIDAIISEFPDALKTPVIEKLNPLQESVMDIAIIGADRRAVETYADNVLSNKITAMPGIASVSVFGGEKRAIRIAMDPERMAARGVTVLDIVSVLGTANLNVPGGKIESSADSNNVRLIGEFDSIDSIKNLRITTTEGQNFTLSDIASISDTARDIETGARYNGQDVVILSVEKASDGNAIKISENLRKVLPELEKQMQEHFANEPAFRSSATPITANAGDSAPSMQIISDSSTLVLNETHGTILGIALGIVLTILTLLFFTSNWRSTIIASVVIPASLIASFFLMQGSGFTINTFTLLAMSSALGTLISNAIILIEAALRELDSGKSSEQAAIDGTKKVLVPILAGTGTNIVVFLPIAFMGGIVGQFMSQFGMSVVYLTLLSLLFSFSLTPMMIARFLRRTKSGAAKFSREKQDRMPRLRRWFDYQLAHPWRVVILALAALLAAAMLLRFVGNEFAPATDANEIAITARAPSGSTFAKSKSIAIAIEDKLKEFPEVMNTSVKIGRRGLQNISIKVGLVDRGQRISDKKLAQKMLPVLTQIPDAEIQIKAGQNVSSGAVQSDMVLDIYGDDDALRKQYAADVLRAINAIPEIGSAVLADQMPGDELKFVPNQHDMNFLGIKNSVAGMALRTAIFGHDGYKYKEAGKEIPIIIEFAPEFKSRQIFDSIYLPSQKGLVPISSLGYIRSEHAVPDIRRIDKSRITEININLGKSTVGPVQKKIESELAKLDWRAGYFAKFGGMSEIQAESASEIGNAFFLAVMLTFMVLAAILNSWAHPFTIATAILFSFTGVFTVIFLAGANINVAAMLAIVMLVGLVVNNNILVLEPAVHDIAKGAKLDNALWAQFVDKKRMILMTTIAVMAGMVPQLWSAGGMKSSMAAVIIGGMLGSLIFTFVLTPALFKIMEDLRKKIR